VLKAGIGTRTDSTPTDCSLTVDRLTLFEMPLEAVAEDHHAHITARRDAWQSGTDLPAHFVGMVIATL
jgi:hypothetical protein